MKKLLILLIFALTFAVSGLAQSTPQPHWPDGDRTMTAYYLMFNSGGSFNTQTWADLSDKNKAPDLTYNVSWLNNIPTMGNISYTCDGITYSRSVANLGNGVGRIDFTWKGPNNTGGTISFFIFRDNPGVMFDSQGNIVNPDAGYAVTYNKSFVTSSIANGGMSPYNLPGNNGNVTFGEMQVVNSQFGSGGMTTSLPDGQGGILGQTGNYNVTWVGDTMNPNAASIPSLSGTTSGSFADGTNWSVGLTNMGNGCAMLTLTLTSPGGSSISSNYFVYANKPGKMFDDKGNEVDPHTLQPKPASNGNSGNTASTSGGGLPVVVCPYSGSDIIPPPPPPPLSPPPKEKTPKVTIGQATLVAYLTKKNGE